MKKFLIIIAALLFLPMSLAANTTFTERTRNKNWYAENYATFTTPVVGADFVRTGLVNGGAKYRGMMNIDLSSANFSKPYVTLQKLEVKTYQFANSGGPPPPSNQRAYQSNSFTTCTSCTPGISGPPYSSCSCSWSDMCSANGFIDVLVFGPYTASSPCNNNSFTDQIAPGNGNFMYHDITNLWNTDPDKKFALVFMYTFEGQTAAPGSNYQDYDLNDQSSNSGFLATYSNDIPTITSCNITAPVLKNNLATARIVFSDTTPTANITAILGWKLNTSSTYTQAALTGSGANYKEFSFTPPQSGAYSLNCSINDLYNTTQTEFPNQFTVENLVPSPTTPVVSTFASYPAQNSYPKSSEDLWMAGSCIDGDDSTSTITYNTYKNNTLQGAYSGSLLVNNNTLNLLVVVPNAATTISEIWRVETKCNDSSSSSAFVSSLNATINGTAPFTTVNITPTTANTFTVLSCNNGTLSDADNDTVSILSYDWYKNGIAQGINSKILADSYNSPLETWNCSITLSDGYFTPTFYSSNTVFIMDDTKPTLWLLGLILRNWSSRIIDKPIYGR